MKTNHRLALTAATALAACASLRAETAAKSVPDPRPPATAQTAEPATAPAPTTAASTRFSTFDTASPEVQTAVANAQAIATTLREGSSGQASITSATLANAVATATTAIVQEGRIARAEVLAERQAALTRLRLAQTEQERRRLMEGLRVQAGQRMEEQREIARLVRDRLRELRDTTNVTPRPGG